MSAFQEVDDYCTYQGIEYAPNHRSHKIKVSKIKIAVAFAALRHRLKLRFITLVATTRFKGSLSDLSVHGALIKSDSIEKFAVGDQLKVSIPIIRYLSAENGEYLRVSAKVRRVLISGNAAAVSFEYMSESVQYRLVDFVTAMVAEQMTIRGNQVSGHSACLN